MGLGVECLPSKSGLLDLIPGMGRKKNRKKEEEGRREEGVNYNETY